MLPGRSIQPWNVVEINLSSLGVMSIAGNEYPVLFVDKAAEFSFV